MKPVTLTGFNFDAVSGELDIHTNDGDGYGIVVIRTGACTVQCYAKVRELRAIAHAATVAADQLEMKVQA